MDIFNRPPPISEDTLQYEIYPDISTSSSKESVAALSTLINSHINTLLPNAHIWHRDAFELKLAPSSFKDDEWILEGRMRVGDCVDDEWCVVWLLREVSKLWDVAVRYVGVSRSSYIAKLTIFRTVFTTQTESFYLLKQPKHFHHG
jgi:hypothetical protein